MPNIGLPELAIILVIVLLLFGASRLPKLGKSMGQGIKGFKEGLNESVTDDDETKQVEQAQTAQASAQLPPAAPQAQPVQQPQVQTAPAVQQPAVQQPAVQQPAVQQPAVQQAAPEGQQAMPPASETQQGWTPQPPQAPSPPQS